MNGSKENEAGRENGEVLQEKSIYEEYEDSAERFQSDTRRYLMQHLLDEYPSVGQAIAYNLLQNAIDNRQSDDTPMEIKFIYSSREKRFRFICSGSTGITDWERYNSLHREGMQGVRRRGEGGKVLIPISEVVRTETRLTDGTYFQSLWKEDKIWRSDKDGEKKIFDMHFPPTAIPPGVTVISVEGVYDEVGDRRAGSELANIIEMVRIIQFDWGLFLKEHPEVVITYEADGEVHTIKAWDMPELVDSKEFQNLDVNDSAGQKVGVIDTLFVGLAKNPLKETPPPAIAISTGTHIVMYLHAYSGPNSSRCFGWVKAPFLGQSETSNHFGFKSTRQYRLVREKLQTYISDFMSGHVGTTDNLSQKNIRAISEVTDQLNRLIRERFPDWHPEGGFKEKRKKPENTKLPWIKNAKTGEERYLPGNPGSFSFEVVNPDTTRPSWKLEARAIAISPLGKQIYHKIWEINVPKDGSSLLSDIFDIPADADVGTYILRISLFDNEKKDVINERRISFEVGETPEPEQETKPPTPRQPRKTKKTSKGLTALTTPAVAIFPPEEGIIRESYYAVDENRVIINTQSPCYKISMVNDSSYRCHFARCQIEELATLKYRREIAVLEKDEMTKDRLLSIIQGLKEEKSTFMSEWAKMEELRLNKGLMEPVGR